MCICSPKMVVPVVTSAGNPYWGYQHSNGKYQIKTWLLIPGRSCDLCHAKEEKILGNDFIQWICPYPFWAINLSDAITIIKRIQGYPSNPKGQLLQNRFIDMLDEL